MVYAGLFYYWEDACEHPIYEVKKRKYFKRYGKGRWLSVDKAMKTGKGVYVD